MYGLFAGITTLDVAQLVSQPVPENRKVTSEKHLIAAGGPATNAAITFSVLNELAGRSTATALVTAIGQGSAANLIAEDLANFNLALIDCTAADSAASQELAPAVSNVIVNRTNGTRTLASTNVQLPLRVEHSTASLAAMGAPKVVLIDGYNPELGRVALTWQGPEDTAEAPFASQEHKPEYLRILDGGSWKPWLAPLLGYVDVAVISDDFMPPGANNFADTVQFLRGFGIERVIQTRGDKPVRWWWLGNTGETQPPRVATICTLGAGDVFHGTFAWACATGLVTRETTDPAPAIALANAVAAHSTTSFGTRKWCEDGAAVSEILQSAQE